MYAADEVKLSQDLRAGQIRWKAGKLGCSKANRLKGEGGRKVWKLLLSALKLPGFPADSFSYELYDSNYESRIIFMVRPSMFPPLTITPTFPQGFKRPLNSAAMPRAPEGSTTSFMR